MYFQFFFFSSALFRVMKQKKNKTNLNNLGKFRKCCSHQIEIGFAVKRPAALLCFARFYGGICNIRYYKILSIFMDKMVASRTWTFRHEQGHSNVKSAKRKKWWEGKPNKKWKSKKFNLYFSSSWKVYYSVYTHALLVRIFGVKLLKEKYE